MTNTLPNLLTIGRLLAAPAVALVYVVFDRPMADYVAFVLFIAASLTDYLDGWLARRWNQVSAFGRMLDPIADKAMVVIALAVLIGISALDPLLLIPAAAILFREVFVSGLREYLGKDAGRLRVTKLAKWKTTVQMVAVPALLLGYGLTLQLLSSRGGAAVHWVMAIFRDIAWYGGLAALWLAAALTLATGIDYFLKSLPYLREAKD